MRAGPQPLHFVESARADSRWSRRSTHSSTHRGARGEFRRLDRQSHFSMISRMCVTTQRPAAETDVRHACVATTGIDLRCGVELPGKARTNHQVIVPERVLELQRSWDEDTIESRRKLSRSRPVGEIASRRS